MRKVCTFEELPEQLKSDITTQSEFNVKQGNKAYEIIKCEYDDKLDNARCIIRDDIFALFELYNGKVTTTWLCSSDIKTMYDLLPEVWKV